jgi:hypothetical protein
MTTATRPHTRHSSSLDERKFFSDQKAKERELGLLEREVLVKERELARSRWLNPTVLGLFAAALGLLGTLIVAERNNSSSRQLENVKLQSSLIIQAISTGDATTACKNLLFFRKLGLLEDPRNLIDQCASSPANTPVLPSSSITYKPADDPISGIRSMDTVVKKSEVGDIYKFDVSFTVPSDWEVSNRISAYLYKVDKRGNRLQDMTLPDINGSWSPGSAATFSIDVPKSYLNDSSNQIFLRYCVGTQKSCLPSPNLLLQKQ